MPRAVSGAYAQFCDWLYERTYAIENKVREAIGTKTIPMHRAGTGACMAASIFRDQLSQSLPS
jgi:hypothetical protein